MKLRSTYEDEVQSLETETTITTNWCHFASQMKMQSVFEHQSGLQRLSNISHSRLTDRRTQDVWRGPRRLLLRCRPPGQTRTLFSCISNFLPLRLTEVCRDSFHPIRSSVRRILTCSLNQCRCDVFDITAFSEWTSLHSAVSGFISVYVNLRRPWRWSSGHITQTGSDVQLWHHQPSITLCLCSGYVYVQKPLKVTSWFRLRNLFWSLLKQLETSPQTGLWLAVITPSSSPPPVNNDDMMKNTWWTKMWCFSHPNRVQRCDNMKLKKCKTAT